MQMQRILQISNYMYPHIGGIEQVARDIGTALQGTCEQKIICFNEDASDGEIVCSRAETRTDQVDGIEVIRCGCVTKKASQSISFTFGTQLKKVLRDFRPDIVIFHYPNPFQAFFLLRDLRPEVRMILYWHLDITKQKILGRIFHRQTIRLLNRASQVVATSPVYIDGSPYLSRFREKCVVIPNCINEQRLAVTENSRGIAEQIKKQNHDKIICFAIGRHIPYKGYTYLIRAAKRLDDRFRIFIGGSGPLTEQLKAEAAGDQKITFLGRISDEELIAWYMAMDIFCFPSITKNEAFGIALAEGMYFGKPAVTFTIPGSGVNYVSLDGETGIEVPNKDVGGYAEALKKIADDQIFRERLGQQAKSRVKENFLFAQFKKSICQMFLNIL